MRSFLSSCDDDELPKDDFCVLESEPGVHVRVDASAGSNAAAFRDAVSDGDAVGAVVQLISIVAASGFSQAELLSTYAGQSFNFLQVANLPSECAKLRPLPSQTAGKMGGMQSN